jgi:transposase
MLSPGADTILSLLAEQPNTTLAEFQDALAKKGHRFSVSAIWRFFDRRRISLKRSPRTQPKPQRPDILKRREAWFESQLDLDPEELWRAATDARPKAKG